MRNLRSLMIIVVILGLLIAAMMGCQTLKQAFCSPTAQQMAEAANYVANADAILAFLSNLAPSAEVSAVMAAIKMAKAVFDQVKAGICVPAAQEQAAQTALRAGQTMAMKYGYRP
jgi:alkylhydroperoxidase/carboxymuconolactone decarboxylase family protein YurZ